MWYLLKLQLILDLLSLIRHLLLLVICRLKIAIPIHPVEFLLLQQFRVFPILNIIQKFLADQRLDQLLYRLFTVGLLFYQLRFYVFIGVFHYLVIIVLFELCNLILQIIVL